MTKTYRIRRVDDAQPLVDLRSMFRGVFGFGRIVPACATTAPDGSIRFAAQSGPRIVGNLTLRRPEGPGGTPTVQRLDAEPEHQLLGCREALLDVAQQWAQANEYSALEVRVPSMRSIAIDFYLANGFHIVGGQRESGADGTNVVLRLRLAQAKPHADTWYSKAHGQWFATMAQH